MRLAQSLYFSAASLASPQSAIKTEPYVSLDEVTSFRSFATTLAGHIAATAAK